MIDNPFVQALIFILPSYVANASPVLVRKVIKVTHPIDLGKNFIDGKRVLGDGKTFEGFFIGVIAGCAVGSLLAMLSLHTLWGSFILSLGTLLGDIMGSFIKRRVGIKRGEMFPLLDQLLFLITSVTLYSLIVEPLPLTWVIFLLVITPWLHLLTNYLAFKIGLKDVPW